MRFRAREGFTLIELLVVMAIVGFLAAALLVVVPLMQNRARKSATEATLGRLKLALVQYKGEFGFYPHGEEYTGPGNVSALDKTGSIYILWKGWGPGGTPAVPNAPLPGKIKSPQGKLLDFLEEKSLSFASDDVHKQWPLDAWGNRILYGLWRPAPNAPYDPYFVAISLGTKTDDAADDIVVKGND